MQLLVERGHEVVANVGTADELIEAVAEFTPEVVIVDIRMPPTFTDEGLVARGGTAPTPRGHEVLALMAEGHSNSALAQHLSITERAVEKHVSAIFTKLDLPPSQAHHRRVLAVVTYLELLTLVRQRRFRREYCPGGNVEVRNARASWHV
ncbi:MAG: hypothetical protein QOF25_5510 [Mycobacterium sp.]|nr:hypothetical protein [Mycobacterium sp.]